MDGALLRELQNRGRFFYERFPGAAAAEKWKQQREKGEREDARAGAVIRNESGTEAVVRHG
jgi:hypothetical protein